MNSQKALSNFFVAGINYKKSDASTRGLFSINNDQYEQILKAAPSYGVTELIVLSTCNRTEIYGFAESADCLCRLLCEQSSRDFTLFTSICYIKKGLEAVEHIFNVAAGLDSQILGDYEIVGQLRQAAKFSKTHDRLGAYTERLLNEVMQSSKKIRTTTSMSGGTVSVSFAAVQYIRAFDPERKKKNILLIGTGKFGSNTCKNLVDYLPGYKLTLINRTPEKASALAEQYKGSFRLMEDLQGCIDAADIILVATNADTPVIYADHIKAGSGKLVIDLSIPCNIDPAVKALKGITHTDVDELSRIKDETLQKRTKEIPKAKEIIAENIEAFLDWHHMRKNVPVLKAVKHTLLSIRDTDRFPGEICIPVSSLRKKSDEERIQKVINGMAVKLRTGNRYGCNYIEAINEFISPSSN